MTLLLVRHGESTGNTERVIQGWLDRPLTARGLAQAERVAVHLDGHLSGHPAGRLAGNDAVALYSSPLARARHTADRIAARLSLPVIEESNLREYCFGEAQGLAWAEARARWDLGERDWGAGRVPGEEGMPAFRERVWGRLHELAMHHRDGAAIVVAHGGVIGAFAAVLFGLEPAQHPSVHAANGSITTVAVEHDRLVIHSLNDRCHLDGEAGVPASSGPGT